VRRRAQGRITKAGRRALCAAEGASERRRRARRLIGGITDQYASNMEELLWRREKRKSTRQARMFMSPMKVKGRSCARSMEEEKEERAEEEGGEEKRKERRGPKKGEGRERRCIRSPGRRQAEYAMRFA